MQAKRVRYDVEETEANATSEVEQDSSDVNDYMVEELGTQNTSLVKVHELVRSMRRKHVQNELQTRFGLQEVQPDEWEGGSPDVSALSPFKIVLLGEEEESQHSVRVLYGGLDYFDCNRDIPFGLAFERQIRNITLLKRLAARPLLPSQKWKVENNMCLFFFGEIETRAARITLDQRSGKFSILVAPSSHPLEGLLAKLWDEDPSDSTFDQGLRLLADSSKVIDAAKCFASRKKRTMRVSAVSVANLHFVFDNGERLISFDCIFNGTGGALTRNRLGWDPKSRMMQQLTLVDEVRDVLMNEQ